MDNERISRQNRLHQDVSRYVNGCGGSRAALLQSLIAPRLPYRLQSAGLAQSYQRFKASLTRCDEWDTVLNVDRYAGINPHVRRMMSALEPLEPMLCGAYVHGSLATEDTIPYSDFDALVILKERVFDNADRLRKVCFKLNQLRRIMFEYDPLQHHGWFVLTEADLSFYCDAYFPVELFKFSKSLLPSPSSSVRVARRDPMPEFRRTFDTATNNISAKLVTGPVPDNMFGLKSMLSQIMLLPALWLQAKSGQATYKAFSFDAARVHFDERTWAAMDEISAIRSNWHYAMGPLRRILLTRPIAPRRFITRWHGPPITPNIRERLNADLFEGIRQLIHAMRDGLVTGDEQ